ncbi:MAG: CDP-diacylglycerol--glycerol-3-phosphate 3-phosphatidyltransferase [Nitrospiria bacterium]
MNLPNILTLLRIALIPLFVIIYSNPTPLRSFIATITFLLAALTDFLDGYLARKRGEITQFGKLMDPIADKLLVISALLLLVYFQRIQVWMVIILIGREMAVTGLRAIASIEGIIIPADRWGKYKMGAQITALSLLLWNVTGRLNFQFWGTLALWIALILSIFSGIQYFINYAREAYK